MSINDIKKQGLKGVCRNILNIKNKENKSKQIPIKTLRFQLKHQESYYFYKNNVKFTKFLLNILFNEKKEMIRKIMKRYKELKGSKKIL
ncbi:chromosome replication/partitioning protein [Borreliella valaisiana]|uniref:chromosome replication/partitioning protein n=1 Tax=Borreliella valaisiana TaxID=62088 RepID=UPI002ED2A91C|nr:chromosome replication/partitioning protein [Borreliella valaisiana]